MGFPFCFFTYSVSASFHSLVMVLGGAGAVMKRVKAIGKRRRKHRTQQKKKKHTKSAERGENNDGGTNDEKDASKDLSDLGLGVLVGSEGNEVDCSRTKRQQKQQQKEMIQRMSSHTFAFHFNRSEATKGRGKKGEISRVFFWVRESFFQSCFMSS